MTERVGSTRIIKIGKREALAVRCARVKVLRGPDKGRAIELGQRQSAVIGSDPDSDLPLGDKTVSRRHAEIVADERGHVIRDLGSTNGIRAGGLLVREALLDEDKLLFTLGETDLSLTLARDEVEHSLSNEHSFGALLGESTAMRALFAMMERAADGNATVLIEGESGTGKEVIAESLHRASPRAAGPFVVVDSSAIAANLIESELFGHVKGAFTGATANRTGAFEEASGGTLFLDEVGELPLDLQPKFLRALERKQVRPVGANGHRDVDVRIIAATHRNLERAVAEGKFRADLFYRLAVIKIDAPALRHHREDVPLLARHFLGSLAPGRDPDALLTGAVLDAFAAYSWPGNVRELRNAVERLVALGELALPRGGAAAEPAPVGEYDAARRSALDRFERQYCERLLSESGGVVTKAAERAGISRQMLYKLLERHGLEKKS